MHGLCLLLVGCSLHLVCSLISLAKAKLSIPGLLFLLMGGSACITSFTFKRSFLKLQYEMASDWMLSSSMLTLSTCSWMPDFTLLCFVLVPFRFAESEVPGVGETKLDDELSQVIVVGVEILCVIPNDAIDAGLWGWPRLVDGSAQLLRQFRYSKGRIGRRRGCCDKLTVLPDNFRRAIEANDTTILFISVAIVYVAVIVHVEIVIGVGHGMIVVRITRGGRLEVEKMRINLGFRRKRAIRRDAMRGVLSTAGMGRIRQERAIREGGLSTGRSSLSAGWGP
ncbi:hypothetical protein DFH29DRAFT_878241 [Suillus ampliporus]|nr:hypothetical protein DFH29DRAFT_878241 [Suillus ampliporus]